MADTTGIEWTDATWNPIRGCSRVSDGCRNCYAEGVARRFSGPGLPYEGLTTDGKWNGTIRFVEEHLLDPLRWKTPRRIFVNSMSDLFHASVTDEMRDHIFAVMALCPQHTFQILTKRPERMLAYLADCVGRLADRIEAMRTDEPRRAVGPLPHLNGGERWFPLSNVWLGVSVENQAAANERIPVLLRTPAAVRFLSCEPLLGPVSLRWKNSVPLGVEHPRHLQPKADAEGRVMTDEYDGVRELDWVICGGESGPHARPMHPGWARSLRDQCVAAGVPLFFKQWGEWKDGSEYPHPELTLYPDGRTCEFTREAILAEERRSGIMHADGRIVSRVGKKAAGDLLDGVQWHQFPVVGEKA